jgi:hypothetical protein
VRDNDDELVHADEVLSQREYGTSVMHKRTPTVIVLAVIVLSMIMTGAAVVTYTGYAQKRSDHRWCELLNSIDQPGVSDTTERARNAQRQIHRLRVDFGCTDR